MLGANEGPTVALREFPTRPAIHRLTIPSSCTPWFPSKCEGEEMESIRNGSPDNTTNGSLAQTLDLAAMSGKEGTTWTAGLSWEPVWVL
jgi:hypothetical protein